jgi:ATP-dependent Clp protease ATP-binding subunit ClpB
MISQLSPARIVLQLERKSATVLEFESALKEKIVGQNEAVSQFVSVYQTVLAGMAVPDRPIASLLLLGPTGSGKTRIVEAAAEILFGKPTAFIKVDCAEFQHSHEVAKLLGSPPGYIGHRETQPVLTQEAINHYQTDRLKLTFLLFDEIEKANEGLWQLLLGILDKGTLTLGDNQKVDLSRTVVVMSSNLGAAEMSRVISGTIGFVTPAEGAAKINALDEELQRVAVDAAKRRFSPEFINRLDKIVVFRTLAASDLRKILDIELLQVQRRIMSSQGDRPFTLKCTDETKEFLLQEGTDTQYGARHLRRAIERHVVIPLASLIASGQIACDDDIVVDWPLNAAELVFSKTLKAEASSSGAC